MLQKGSKLFKMIKVGSKWKKNNLLRMLQKRLCQAEVEVMPSSNLVEVEVGLIRCKLDEVRCNIFEI